MATQVGEASVALKFDTKGAAASLKSETQSALASAGKSFSAWVVAHGNIAARAFEKVASIMVDSLQGGITRFDTINRFPKVMEAIGYSADDAAEAVQNVWQYVQGLPTPFNEALSAVQRLASSTDSLEEATKVYKAMNNALLSGGADINRQSQVMTQWLQAVSRGKFVGQEWNDMMEVMPGVMNAATKDLLGSKAGAEQLRDALSSGKITMSAFLDEIIKLNDKGSDSFAALNEQAKVNTEGISTKLTTMRQSIENIWMHVMEAIGSDNIQAVLSAIEDGIDAFGDALVNLVNWVKESWVVVQPILQKVWEWISTYILPAIQGAVFWIIANVAPMAQQVFEAVGPVIEKIMVLIDEIVPVVRGVVEQLAPILEPALQFVGALISGTINSIIMLVMGLINLISAALDAAIWAWENIISPIVAFVSAVIDLIVGFVTGSPDRVNGAIERIKALFINAFNAAKDWVGARVSDIVNFVTSIPGKVAGKINEIKDKFVDAFNQAKDFIKGVVDSIVEFIMSIPSRIAGIGGEIAGSIMSGLGDIGGQIGGAISSGVSSAVSGLGGAVQGALSAIGLASGGYVKATPGGTLAVIGEGGEDEFVIPRSKMIDILSGVATSPLPELKADNMRVDGGGIVVYNTYEINNELDADDIGRRINNSIRLATI